MKTRRRGERKGDGGQRAAVGWGAMSANVDRATRKTGKDENLLLSDLTAWPTECKKGRVLPIILSWSRPSEGEGRKGGVVFPGKKDEGSS